MKPAPFAYHAPATVADVLSVLGEYGDDAKVLAGGQSLVPLLALRLTRFPHLVDLNRVADLSRLERVNGFLEVGAMTRQATVEHAAETAAVPLLARAVPLIGHFQIRNRGTIGGSIAHADPASELPAVALALDAEMVVAGPAGVRTVAATDFFVSTWTTTLGPPTFAKPATDCTSAWRCWIEFSREHRRASPQGDGDGRGPDPAVAVAHRSRDRRAQPRHP